MTRIPLIAISLTLLVLGGCSNAEIPLEPSATTASLPQPPNAQVRTLDAATFTAQSREIFCDAVQDAIDKRHTVEYGKVSPDGEISDFGKASRYIAEVAAPEEAEAWKRLSELNIHSEKMEIDKGDTNEFLWLYDQLEYTVTSECSLPMP